MPQPTHETSRGSARRKRHPQGIELRARGVDKGLYVRQLLAAGHHAGCHHPEAFVLAAGDDRTDRHMLDALPSGVVGIYVGPLPADTGGRSCVGYTLDSPAAVRALLCELPNANE